MYQGSSGCKAKSLSSLHASNLEGCTCTFLTHGFMSMLTYRVIENKSPFLRYLPLSLQLPLEPLELLHADLLSKEAGDGYQLKVAFHIPK